MCELGRSCRSTYEEPSIFYHRKENTLRHDSLDGDQRNRWLEVISVCGECFAGYSMQQLKLSSSNGGADPAPTIIPVQEKMFPFVLHSLIICFIWLLFWPSPLRAQLGTTPNIKHIVVGRCYNYMALVDPSSRFDCEEIWRQFEEAVVRQSYCNVTVEDYHQMFHEMPQSWPCNRFLFWSKTRTLMHSYAAVVRHFWTLEDTLVGYMFNDLIWCGQEDAGFDFGSCPEWSACGNHPVYSLWKQASQIFSEMACGNITVLLNGSVVNAFNRKSMFGSVELDSLNPRKVDYVNIKVVSNLEGPYLESCSRGSIVDLLHILRSRGFRWTCTDSDQTLMILQCLQDPDQPSCQTCANSLLRSSSASDIV